MAPSYRIEPKLGQYAGGLLLVLLLIAASINGLHLFDYFYGSINWLIQDVLLALSALLFLIAQLYFSFKLVCHWRQHLPFAFMLQDDGAVLLDQQQYSVDCRSVYFGPWAILVLRQTLSAKTKRLFFAPDSLSLVERRRIKRVIKRLK